MFGKPKKLKPVEGTRMKMTRDGLYIYDASGDLLVYRQHPEVKGGASITQVRKP